MTLPRLYDLNDYWRELPPVHVSLARLNNALLTEKTGSGKGKATQQADGDLNDFIASFVAQGGKIDGV